MNDINLKSIVKRQKAKIHNVLRHAMNHFIDNAKGKIPGVNCTKEEYPDPCNRRDQLGKQLYSITKQHMAQINEAEMAIKYFEQKLNPNSSIVITIIDKLQDGWMANIFIANDKKIIYEGVQKYPNSIIKNIISKIT